MTSKPVLYDYLFSGNCYKIRLLLSQLGVAFETRPIDILAGEARCRRSYAKIRSARCRCSS